MTFATRRGSDWLEVIGNPVIRLNSQVEHQWQKNVGSLSVRECGYVSLKWLGRCPECQKWNSLTEEIEFETSSPAHRTIGSPSRQPEPIIEVSASEEDRRLTGIQEFDRVLGDGIVPGSVILIGGDPGHRQIDAAAPSQRCLESGLRHGAVRYGRRIRLANQAPRGPPRNLVRDTAGAVRKRP